MKKIVFTIMALLGASVALAQTGTERLVNRIDGQGGIHVNSSKPASNSLSFDIVYSTPKFPVSGGHRTLTGMVYNHTLADLKVGFFRTHIRKPEGWTSSVCMGVCFSANQDSLPQGYEYSVGPLDSAVLEYNVDYPKFSFPDTLIDYIKYVAFTGNDADTIGVTLTGYLLTAGVEKVQNNSTASKILSLYPSPLIEGNSIRVKVSSPKEQSFTYSISDELGRSVAFGTTHQRLSQGDNNICQIGELAGLSTGTYLLKFTFADGSVDTRTFQVAH